MDVLAKNLKKLRGKQSQEKFAQECDLSRETIRRIESGEGAALETIVKIADARGVSVDVLLGRAVGVETLGKVSPGQGADANRTHESASVNEGEPGHSTFCKPDRPAA